MRVASVLVLAIAGLPAGALGAIYTCADEQGRTVFRDSPCRVGERPGVPAEPEEARPKARAKRTAASTDGPLERKQVERLVAALDKAMAKRDPKAVTRLLAKDAVVEMHLAGARKSDPMDRKDFARYLAAAFARSDYVYQAKTARISLSKDKSRATVSRQIREAVLVEGTVVVSDFAERLTVERDGRRLVIRKLRKAPPRVKKGT